MRPPLVLMQMMFGAVRAIKPDLPQPQRPVTTLENPERFMQKMQEAGFRNVEIRCVTKPLPVTTLPEFWDNMVRGRAPLQILKKSMGEAVWCEKENIALDFLKEKLPGVGVK